MPHFCLKLQLTFTSSECDEAARVLAVHKSFLEAS